MVCGLRKERKLLHWSPPNGLLKFNVDGVANSKLGQRVLEE